MKNKNLYIAGMGLMILILVSSFVYAFGVAYDPTPMTMSAGETRTVYLNIQNVVGTGDVTARVEIINGSEIASINEDTYFVKLGSYDTDVPVEIKIPRDEPKENYRVTLEVRTVTPGETGAVAIGIGTRATFSVIVAGVAKREINARALSIAGLIIAIVIVSMVIVMLLNKKRKKLKKSK